MKRLKALSCVALAVFLSTAHFTSIHGDEFDELFAEEGSTNESFDTASEVERSAEPPAPPPPPDGDSDLETPETADLPAGASTEVQKAPDAPVATISVRTYPVEIFSRSKSNKMYLIRDVDDVRTRVGRIVLLKKDSEPRMAYRVLKTYYASRLFAARRIRRYDDIQHLDPGEAYTAYEKVDDIAPPVTTQEDLKDIEELEENANDLFKEFTPADVNPNDPIFLPANGPGPEDVPLETDPLDAGTENLDAAIAEAPAGDGDNELDAELQGFSDDAPSEEAMNDLEGDLEDFESFEEKPEERPLTLEELEEEVGDDEELPLSIEDVQAMDRNNHSVTVQFAAFRSAKLALAADGSTQPVQSYFTGGGLRYGLTLGKMLFAGSTNLQDSLVLEGGAFLYKVFNVDPNTSNDAYSVIPLLGTLRYNLLFSEDLSLFFYGGMLKSFIIPNSQGTDLGSQTLAAPQVAAGGGLIFRIGPNWETRVDLGVDMLGAGIMLRF